MATVHLKTSVKFNARVSPFSYEIPKGSYFKCPQPWYRERAHSPVLKVVPAEEFYAAALEGEVLNVSPDEVPERFQPEEENVEDETVEASEQDEPEDEPEEEDVEEKKPETDAEKAAYIESVLDADGDAIRQELPDDAPGENDDPVTRITYVLLEGDYNAQRTVLADVSERSANGDGEDIRARLCAELYDLQYEG